MISSEDDVFSSPDPPIVDCDVLEAAKENVQPLGPGRRVTALSTILSAPHAHREAKLQLTRNRLRMNVELALASTSSQSDEMQDLEIPNPSNALDAYWNFVSWTIDNYPQGHSAESGLLELLEEATRILKDHDDGKWRKDVKYLKLWLLYASHVEKPVVIYKFLVANEIGTIWALLYEEYAAVLERDGRCKEADEAYSLGIARRAVSTEHLQERYNDFQKRMMNNMMFNPAPPPGNLSQKPRAALTTTSLRPPSSSTAGQTPCSVSMPMATSATSNSSKLQVFVDATSSTSLYTDDPLQPSGTWQDLGTRKTRVKENIPEMKKMTGTTLKQAGKSKRVASSSSATASSLSFSSSKSGDGDMSAGFSVFRDPGPEGESGIPTSFGHTAMPPPSTIPKVKTESTRLGNSTSGVSLPKTPAKSTFVPFIGGSSSNLDTSLMTSAPGGSLATPRPTALRDEPVSMPALTTSTVATTLTDSAIKVKKAGLKSPLLMSSEAEALRKDPLKNYQEHERELISGGFNVWGDI